MPPRSKKVAAAKKPSPRGNKSTRRNPASIGTDPPAAAEVISADDVKLESPVTAELSPVAAALVDEDKEPEVDAKEEITAEKVEEETAEREAVDTPLEAAEGGNEDPLEVAEGGDVQEASGVGDGKDTDAEDNKMEIEGKENDAEENEMEIVGKENDAEENKMKVDGNETSAAKNKVEVEEGDKQLVEGETGVGEVEHICGSVADNDGNVERIVGVSDNNVTRDCEADDGENEEVDDEADGGENEEVDDEADDGENEVDDEDNEDEEDDEENEEDEPALYVQAPLTERKRQKHFEIFVGGLDKGAVEEDVIKVFGTVGEIQSVRIVKHPVTQKSKGFAFVLYASMEHAKKALTEFKDGTEVKGKQIKVSAGDDNDTLYLGNICKTWTKDNVIETLKGYGIEQIEDIRLPEDPKHEGRIRGFAFVEFTSHTDAVAAFQLLRKPGAVFGRDISAKVCFAQTPLHPSEESLLQVKTVYLEGIPRSWDEVKVGELCKQHGEIEKIQLSRNFASTKKKDFGFVEFSSRDAAIACVEGVNNAELREGDINVRASLAKPMNKGRLALQIARGGYNIKMDGEAAKEVSQPKKKKAKSNVTHDKGEIQPKLKSSSGSKPSKPQRNGSNGGKGKSSQSSKDKKRGRQGMDAGTGGQASKKARKDGRVSGRPSTGFGNQRNSYSSSAYVTQQTSYAPSYATPAASYAAHAYAGTSGSYHRRSDMAPHAGFVPAAQQVRNPYDYQLQRPGAYDRQLRGNSEYAGASLSGAPYTEYSSHAGYQAGHTYPSLGAYGYRGPYY